MRLPEHSASGVHQDKTQRCVSTASVSKSTMEISQELAGVLQNPLVRDGDLICFSPPRVEFLALNGNDGGGRSTPQPAKILPALNLAVNCAKVYVAKDMPIYEYVVRFDPDVDSLESRRRVMRTDPVAKVIGTTLSFTGTNLYLPVKLARSTVVNGTTVENVEVKISIDFIKIPSEEHLTPFFNTLFRRAMQILKMVPIQRHYFLPDAKIAVPQHKLEVWPGYISTVQVLDGGLLLLIDSTYRVLRTSTARDMLRELASGQGFKELAMKTIVGSVVLTRYNNKAYRIDDIAFGLTPTDKFKLKNGEEISFVDYYKRHWGLDIIDLNQPLLIHRPKPKRGESTEAFQIVLIPELCLMSGIPEKMRADMQIMRDIASHTRISPQTRVERMVELLKSIDSSEEAKKVFDNWNIKLSMQPLRTQGVQLDNEKVYFGNSGEVTVSGSADWNRGASANHVIKPIALDSWLLIYTTAEAYRMHELVKCLRHLGTKNGITIRDPLKVEIKGRVSTVDYIKAIRGGYNDSTQLVFVVMRGPEEIQERYDAIKKECCCELGVPSQLLRLSTLGLNGQSPMKMNSVCKKILLQVCSKLGGELWRVQIPFKNSLIIGMDVYHDPDKRAKSVLAMVSSSNKTVTRWFSRAFFQGANEEISNQLQKAAFDAAANYYEETGDFPDKVFIYRDGVGDGQLSVVNDFELPQLKQGLQDFALKINRTPPPVALLVVQKRNNTRMFLERKSDTFTNPSHGSVLDKDVTRADRDDFFLISQRPLNGTANPSHYVVLCNEMELSLQRLEIFTYKLTHLYNNWTGTISVPAPCQFAHKLAYMVGENLKKLPKETLSDKLFYL